MRIAWIPTSLGKESKNEDLTRKEILTGKRPSQWKEPDRSILDHTKTKRESETLRASKLIDACLACLSLRVKDESWGRNGGT